MKNILLGHGDHWSALYLDWDAGIEERVEGMFKEGLPKARFTAPWPDAEIVQMLRFEISGQSLALTCLVGVVSDEKMLRFLSCFPRLLVTEPWTLEVTELSEAYGFAEGMVVMEVEDGGELRAFAPLFGEERARWPSSGKLSVQLAGLALNLAIYPAEPFRITEGPLLALERERLRTENDPEAETLDHVMVHADSLRTLYCGDENDHAGLVGRIERVTALESSGKIPGGWLLHIEVQPDERPSGRILPVYAFPPALGDYRPQVGDLVQGTVWVQVSLPAQA